MEKRYTALRTIGTFYKILGIVTAVITVLVILSSCAMIIFGTDALRELNRSFSRDLGFYPTMPYRMMGGLFGGLLGMVMAVIFGGGLALTLYAMGEGVYLLIAIEENTRASTALLTQHDEAEKTPPVE
jgi:hypothetical protein